jgi:hypothetical protein
MKAFAAYAILVLGVPVFIGLVVGTVFTMPITRLLHNKTSISLSNLFYLEIVNGFVASLAGAFLFWIFGLTPGIAVPLIIAAWATFYFFSYHQPKREWISWLVGLFIGWFTLARMIIAN